MNDSKPKEQAASNPKLLTRFERAALWNEVDRQFNDLDCYTEALLKDEVESRALARAYAGIIAMQWRRHRKEQQHAYNERYHLLELDAGNGQFASRVLAELNTEFNDDEWRFFQPVYLLADRRPERVSECWQHSALRTWIEQGHLEPVVYDARLHQHLEIKSRNLVLGKNSITTPLVVIANGVFSSMQQSYFHIHYGRCFRSLVADPDAQSPSTELEFHWRLISDPNTESSLLAAYLERLDSGHVLIPDQALTSIDNLRALAQNECLCLITDRGFHSELDLREQSLPVMAPTARYFLPLNCHALNWQCQQDKGRTVHVQHSRETAVHSVLCYPADRLNEHQVEQYLLSMQDASVRQLVQFTYQTDQALDSEYLLSLLRLSEFDIRFLFNHLPALLAAAQAMDTDQCRRWREALKSVWSNVYLFAEEAGFLTEFALFAIAVGARGIAHQSLQTVNAWQPENPEAAYWLASNLLNLGRQNQALNVLRQLQISSADEHSELALLADYVYEYQAYCNSDACYDEYLATGRDLSLQPLADHFCEEFLHQYRDPSIAVMTSLPEMTNPEQYLQWLRQQREISYKSHYAVIHKDCGFIGVVSASWYLNDAFFYFWIGADFQGRGFGQRAAQRLFAMLKASRGISRVFTSAFQDNSRSIAALKQMQFDQLSVRAQEPDQDLNFFVRSEQAEPAEQIQQGLVTLLHQINSPIQLLSEVE